jgi:L-alanine-DL-glutamate epimerase-like enolase superfamily enzyme
MKITGIRTMILKKKVEKPVADSLHVYDVGGHLLTMVDTDEGITGNGISYFGRIESGMEIVKLIVERVLAPVIIGQEPCLIRKMRNEMFVATEYFGTVGAAHFGISAIDCALWDIMGKKAGLPVAKLLGARRESIPAYAMAGWYYEGGFGEFLKHCTQAVEEGFRALKIKVGKGPLKEDIERIRLIHKEFGDDFRVMVDANCIFDEAEASFRGKAYDDENVFWFEEPMQPYMRDAHSRLAQRIKTPIAIGENYYTRHQFYDVIKAGCAGIIQPDCRRAGGPTEWLDIGAISEAAGLKLASHGGGPQNVNILCALENAIYIESGSLKSEKAGNMLKTRLIMRDGQILIPETPGMGTEVSEDYIAKYRIDI